MAKDAVANLHKQPRHFSKKKREAYKLGKMAQKAAKDSELLTERAKASGVKVPTVKKSPAACIVDEVDFISISKGEAEGLSKSSDGALQVSN